MNHSDYDWSTFTVLRRMRDVHRLSGFHYSRPYSDAEHCYYTGLLFIEMARAHGVHPSIDQVFWVFCHDAMETITGDLLYPAKNTNSETKKAWETIEREVSKKNKWANAFRDAKGMEILGTVQWNLFKACDSLELWMFCVEEEQYGIILKNSDGSTVRETMYAVLRDCGFEHIEEVVS